LRYCRPCPKQSAQHAAVVHREGVALDDAHLGLATPSGHLDDRSAEDHAELAVLAPSPEGQPLYARLGFQLLPSPAVLYAL
jgi:hypothetical protein